MFFFWYSSQFQRDFFSYFQMENSNEKCSDFEAANLKEAEPEMNQDEPLPVIIDLSRVVDIDFTAAVVRIVHWLDRKWRHMNFKYKYKQTRL